MFITIEGGEGAGKSTFAKALQDRFISSGRDVLLTREPGGTSLGEWLRSGLLDRAVPLSPYAELMMFLAARAQHIEERIAPALAAEKVVICDRFHDSTIVYQGIGAGLGEEYVEELCNRVVGEPCFPDITILLHISPIEGLRRKQRQKSFDKFEERPMTYHTRISDGFLRRAQRAPQRYIILDALQPVEVLVNMVYAKL